MFVGLNSMDNCDGYWQINATFLLNNNSVDENASYFQMYK